MPRPEFTFPSFAGGLMNGLANDGMPLEGLRVCDNVAFGKAPIGGVTLRPPTFNRNLVPDEDFYPLWLIRFRGYDTQNWPYLVIGWGWGNMLVVKYINQELSELSEYIFLDREAIDRNYLVQDENKVYFIGGEGTTPPTVLTRDGDDLSLKTMGFPSESISSLTAYTSGGEIPDGEHYYQLILTDANGHKSAPIPLNDMVGQNNVTTTGGDTSRVIVGPGLPTCDGEHKYVYRTLTGVNIRGRDPENYPVFYLVRTLDHMTTVFTDTLSDTTLATHSVLDMNPALPPQDLAFGIIFNGRMWGFTDESSVLRYTPQFDYDNWPEVNAIPIGGPDYLEALTPVGDRLLIFKKTKTYAFWGDSIANFDYREISSTYGTKYPKTIRTIDDNRAIFLDSQERVILFNGGQFTEVSKTIALPESTSYWATLFNDYYILWLYENDEITGYAYYLPTGAWSRWTDIDMLMPEEPNRPGLEYMVYWDGTSISVLGEGFPGWDSDTFGQNGDLVIRTQNTDCGSSVQKKAFKELEIYFEPLHLPFSFYGLIGQLEFIIDEGSDYESDYQKEINYDSSELNKRQKFRIANGLNGTRGSIRFVGTDNMNKVALLQSRLFWQPRGTPQR